MKWVLCVQIPGFHPEKIPESVLVGFFGEQNVNKATVESFQKRTLPHAMTLALYIIEYSFLIIRTNSNLLTFNRIVLLR